MDIVIPLCGKGERFSKEGYTAPKPFITVCGKPILQHAIHRLRLGPEDAVWIFGRPSLQPLYDALEWPAQVKWISVAEETRGAAETVALGLDEVQRCFNKGGERPLLILDGDAFYRIDVVGLFRGLELPAVAVFAVSVDEPPIFSYSFLDDEDRVLAVAEKKAIAPWANTGAYYFPSRSLCGSLAGKVLLEGDSAAVCGEFYISTLYCRLLAEEALMVARRIDRNAMVGLGTPKQVKEYESQAQGWLFDLDGTLVRTEEVYFQAWKGIMTEYGVTLTRELFERHVSGCSDFDVARSFFSSTTTLELVGELARQKDAYMTSHLEHVQIIPGAIEFIQQLRWTGHLVGIVTNSNRTTAEALLKYYDIPYEILVIGNECIRPKPYPHPYETAMHALGIPSQRITILEDSPSGILSARATTPARLVGIVGTQTREALLAQGCTHLWDDFQAIDMEAFATDAPEQSSTSYLEGCLAYSLRHTVPSLARVIIEPIKLKGGYIADVFRVHLDEKICVFKVVTPPTNMLSTMAHELDLHGREFYFYETIAPFVPIEVPRCVQIIRDPGTLAPVGVLLECLAPPSYRQGIDLAEEPMEISMRVVERCAALHAWSWGKKTLQHFPVLQKHDDAMFVPSWTEFVKARWPLFEARWKRVFTSSQLGLLSTIASSFSIIQQEMSREPLCLCHGDVKAPNLFFRSKDMEPIFLDWQYVAYGKGAADIVFLIIESFKPALAKQWGPMMLSYYYAKLHKYGVKDYSPEAFARDTVVAACHFPFFVAMWFGTTPTEDLIDVNFPFFFLQRYMAFLEDRRDVIQIFLGRCVKEEGKIIQELEHRPLGA